MASKQTNVDFAVEQMAGAGQMSSRKMFGEFAIYCGLKIVALFCDDQLFIKPTYAGKLFIGQVTERPPYPGAKPWFLVSGDAYEDAEWVSELVRRTAAELPVPTLKVQKPKSKVAAKTRSSKPKAVTKRKPKAAAKAKAADKPKPKAADKPKPKAADKPKPKPKAVAKRAAKPKPRSKR